LKTLNGNGKHWVIADYEQDGDTSMIISWCGTTKFDWFAVEHESEEDNALSEKSKIAHLPIGDLADPRFEPLDVIALHVVQPAWQNAGCLTPKNTPNIAFASLRHDFDNPLKTQMLIFTTVLDPGEFRNSAEHLKEHGIFQKVLEGGFILTPGTTFFDEADLKKIAARFRTRMKKAMAR